MSKPSAADFARAADTVTRLANQQQDLVLVAEMLSKIGSFTGSAEEAEARAVKANAEADKVLANLADVKAQRQGVEKDAEKVRALAAARAENAVVEAQEKAASILAQSAKEADKQRAKASVDAAAFKQSAEGSAAIAQSAVRRAEAELAGLEALAVEARAELAATQAKIKEARAAIAKALG